MNNQPHGAGDGGAYGDEGNMDWGFPPPNPYSSYAAESSLMGARRDSGNMSIFGGSVAGAGGGSGSGQKRRRQSDMGSAEPEDDASR